ncbi:MAG: OmpA family protein [Alphaproteobacteria bacterium]|nr:OmpA family protein [Alphaproteobacteria bacterium]
MNRMVKLVVAGLGALTLAACATTDNVDLYNQAKGTAPAGSAFNVGLYNGYIQLATEEENPYGDYVIDPRDRDYFAQKAIDAASGKTVMPTNVAGQLPPEGCGDDQTKPPCLKVPDSRPIPGDAMADVTDGRSRLMAAFDAGARDKAPEAAARAQTQFDCWLEQLEENYQPQDIARCRQGFMDALAEVEKALAPPPPPPQAEQPTRPEPFLVFFDFDKSDITPDSARIISEAAQRAKETGAVAIQVIGHTDRAGSVSYNQKLSMRRANAVKAELAKNGIDASTITVEGRGESDPLVPTADGVREPQNRRAEGIWIYR